MSYNFKMTKTYDNGATHTMHANPDKVNAYKAQTDAEDRQAGVTGTWEIEVCYRPHPAYC